MDGTITVTLAEEVRLALQEATREEKLSENELIEKALSDYLFTRKFRLLREQMMKTAQKGYTDQEIFDLVVMKILLDTNVLIAAFIARGFCNELVEHCVRQHNLLTSDFIINEFREKLTNKFKCSLEDTEKAAALLLSKMTVVTPVGLATAVCRDPDDDNVLAAAVAGNCDCLITGDKDLLVLKLYAGIDILSPSEFLDYEESKVR